MARLTCLCIFLTLHFGCQQTPDVSVRKSHSTNADAQPATVDNTQTQTPSSSAPIHLPSQDKAQGKSYPIKGVRPAEVCMAKGFTWLFQGYLQPECGTCHYKDNRYGVTAFGQINEEAASFAVLKTVTDTKKLMQAVTTRGSRTGLPLTNGPQCPPRGNPPNRQFGPLPGSKWVLQKWGINNV